MAGYIMTLNNHATLAQCAESGVYGTLLSEPAGRWQSHHEGTLADYATMKPGDNVYFFIKRRIYGVGRLVAVGQDCKYLNFPAASMPRRAAYARVRRTLLWDDGPKSVRQRWICTFKPDPHFFTRGVDMDDVLSSNPSAFRMLRALWKLSFIKFDDEENQAFRDIIYKSNRDVLKRRRPSSDEVFATRHNRVHEGIQRKVSRASYTLNAAEVMAACASGDALRHEKAIEAGLLYQLATRDSMTSGVFGKWDYLSHQVVASPFKPIDYVDKMDVFGYSYLPRFRPTRSSCLVCEVKRGPGRKDELDQIMKYVDWVKDEYCYGDYSMIRAFLVAYDFSAQVIAHRDQVAKRVFTWGRRPANTLTWDNVALVEYRFDEATQSLAFSVV